VHLLDDRGNGRARLRKGYGALASERALPHRERVEQVWKELNNNNILNFNIFLIF
jgi:hypothetical protein